MDTLLAMCENPRCKSIFPVTTVNVVASIGVTFNNCKADRCPSCGSEGRILDGTYDFINDTVKFIKGPNSTLDILNQVKHLLKTLKDQGRTKQKVVEEIAKISPEFASVAKESSQWKDVREWFIFLFMLIDLAINVHTKFFPSDDEELKNKIIEHLIETNKELVLDNKSMKSHFVEHKRKIGRNEPCPCDSGKKFKRCCGK